MRIRGQGSSPGGFGDHQGDSRRAEAFRRSHRAGQKVVGVVKEWRDQDLAWVEIDGHRLLASVGRDTAPGLSRRFVIESLHPVIVLRELKAQAQGLDVVV